MGLCGQSGRVACDAEETGTSEQDERDVANVDEHHISFSVGCEFIYHASAQTFRSTLQSHGLHLLCITRDVLCLCGDAMPI